MTDEVIEVLKEQIKHLSERVRKLEREVAEEPVEHKVWEPRKGDLYYISGTDHAPHMWGGCKFDEHQYAQGRAFRTKEAAKLFEKRERTLADMHRIAEKHGGEPAPGEPHYYPYFSDLLKKWATGMRNTTIPGNVRFPTEAAAHEAIGTFDLDVFLEG